MVRKAVRKMRISTSGSCLRGICLLLAAAVAAPALDLTSVPGSDWIQLFNKKNLDNGWVKKISGQAVGSDPYHTWYVKDSLLWVDYAGYTGDFADRFGHMAYEKRRFSHFLMRAVYRFWGTQAAGGPDWAKENNGLMYHSQSMESMGLSQSFPDCVEFQLLGERNNQNSDGTTGNVCGIGATFIIDGVRGEHWCRKAKPHNVIGQPWVTVEGLILGDSVSRHIVEGDTVLKYTGLIAKKDGKPLKDGYLAIQGETAPIQFKSIEVLDLEGCMDSRFANYRSYFIKSNPSLCAGTVRTADGPLSGSLVGIAIASLPGEQRLNLPEGADGCRLQVTDLQGKVHLTREAEHGGEIRMPTAGLRAGIYFLRVSDGRSVRHFKFIQGAIQ